MPRLPLGDVHRQPPSLRRLCSRLNTRGCARCLRHSSWYDRRPHCSGGVAAGEPRHRGGTVAGYRGVFDDHARSAVTPPPHPRSCCRERPMCGAVVRDHKTTPPAPVRGVPRICCWAQQESVGRKLIMNVGRRRLLIIQGHRALAEASRRGHDRYRNIADRMTATGRHRLRARALRALAPCLVPHGARPARVR